MPIKPKSKASKLIEQLNILLHQESRDEFTLRKIKREAKALRSTDAFGAFNLMGMLASLEQDAVGARDNHSKALRMNPNDPEANINYSTSLNNLGFYSEAREYAQKAYLANPADLFVLNYLIERCYKSGLIQEANKWLRRWEAESPNAANDNEVSIGNAIRLLNENGVGDDEVEKLMELSLSVLQGHEIYPTRAKAQILEDEESSWLSYMFEVPGTPEEVVALNFEAAEKLAGSSIPGHVTDSVVVTFTSAVS